MALKVGLAWLPISSVVCIIIALIASYAIAVALNHVSPVFTFISDTAQLPPERNVFEMMFHVASNFALTTCYVRYKLVDAYFAQHSNINNKYLTRTNFVALIFGSASTFGFSVVGTFQNIGTTRVVHLIGVAVSVVGFIIYSWLQVALSRYTTQRLVCHESTVVTTPSLNRHHHHHHHHHHWSHWSNWSNLSPVKMTVVGSLTPLNTRYMVAVRATIAASATLTAVSFVVSTEIYEMLNGNTQLNTTNPSYASYAIGSVCEWATTVAILVYILTFVPEFRHVHLGATLSTDPPPTATPAASRQLGINCCHTVNGAHGLYHHTTNGAHGLYHPTTNSPHKLLSSVAVIGRDC